jgi:hypothetical protein
MTMGAKGRGSRGVALLVCSSIFQYEGCGGHPSLLNFVCPMRTRISRRALMLSTYSPSLILTLVRRPSA